MEVCDPFSGLVKLWLALLLQVIDLLKPVEKELLSQKLVQLERNLDPGFNTLNWNSLGVPEFTTVTNKAINEFQTLIAQVQKSSSMIEKVVHQIANTRVIPPHTEQTDVMDLQVGFQG